MTDRRPDLERVRYNVLSEALTDDQFEAFAAKLTEKRYTTGQTILEDETDGEDLFLLAEGRVKITKTTQSGNEHLLALLHAGDFFGELELIDGRPRSARVVALEDCTVFAISKHDFERVLEASHPFTHRLMQVLSIRLRAINNHFVRQMERTSRLGAREVSRLQRLIEAVKVLNSTLDLDRLLTIILDTALHAVDGDRGTVYLVDEVRGELWSRVIKGDTLVDIRLPRGAGIAGHVAMTGETLNIPDAYLDARFNPEIDRKSGYRTRTILCMPMRNKEEKIIGVFQLLNRREGRFTAEDERVLTALSVHAAIAVENARLLEQERQKIALEKDLLAAREVQMALIPKRLPNITGCQFAARTLPAREVGGDLYDFVQQGQNRLGICIGDVSGKGLAAALLMAHALATLRDHALTSTGAAECMTLANRLLYHTTSVERFVTMFYAVLDVRKSMLSYCNAGHEPPFHYSRSSGAIHRLRTGGTVLGIVEEFPFVEETIPFEQGDMLVAFSDGISEAVNGQGEMFGDSRMEELTRIHHADSADVVAERIISAVHAHTGVLPQRDDITLVVIRRT